MRCEPCLVFVLLPLAACAHPAPPPLLDSSIAPMVAVAIARPTHSPEAQRMVVVARAREFLAGKSLSTHGLTFPRDPVGFVRAAFWASELDLFEADIAADERASGMEVLFRSTSLRGRLHKQTPAPGDLVFFDARPNVEDPYPSQVAIVEEVRGTGTITAIGMFAHGPRLVTLNLRLPDQVTNARGERLNDQSGKERTPLAHVFRVFADPFAG